MPSITSQSVAANLAPYADTAIELSLLSVTTERYKTFYCIECRHPFLQRDNTTYYRINSQDEPVSTYVSEGQILTRCGKCRQKYMVSVSLEAPIKRYSDAPLKQISQAVYLADTTIRHLRYMRCLECGGTFVSVTNRVARIVDNASPVEYAAHIEVRCNTGRCRQRWALML